LSRCNIIPAYHHHFVFVGCPSLPCFPPSPRPRTSIIWRQILFLFIALVPVPPPSLLHQHHFLSPLSPALFHSFPTPFLHTPAPPFLPPSIASSPSSSQLHLSIPLLAHQTDAVVYPLRERGGLDVWKKRREHGEGRGAGGEGGGKERERVYVEDLRMTLKEKEHADQSLAFPANECYKALAPPPLFQKRET
jgi:hypothetical protein